MPSARFQLIAFLIESHQFLDKFSMLLLLLVVPPNQDW